MTSLVILRKSESGGRGFGTRAAQPCKSEAAKPERRQPTYAEFSVPGPNEAGQSPQPSIWKTVKSFLLWTKRLVVGFFIALNIFALVFAWGVERAFKEAEKELGRELRSNAAQCTEPAARKRFEEAGWTVRVGANGACSMERPRD